MEWQLNRLGVVIKNGYKKLPIYIWTGNFKEGEKRQLVKNAVLIDKRNLGE